MGCSKAKYEELMEQQKWEDSGLYQYTYMYGGGPVKDEKEGAPLEEQAKYTDWEEEVSEPVEVVSKAQQRKAMPVYSGVLKYFPDALKEVSKGSKAGNDQHHPDKPLHWDKTKSTDNEDALVRHLIDHSKNPIDDDGVLHLTKVAWRALASLQIYLENNEQ